MSPTDDLIAEHCPRGVEYKAISDIGRLVRGNGMPKTHFTKDGVGAIHYGQIYTYYGTWTTETISFVSPERASKLAKVEPGDLIITNASENLEDVGKAVAWLGSEQIVTGGHATVLKHCQDSKFLSYWFQTPEFFAQKKKLATGTKVIDVSAKNLARVHIPVPPMEVQREIVRILDHFTALEAELEARRRQYEHYRSVLLSNPAHDAGWRPCRLGDVSDILVGFPFKSAQFSFNTSDARLIRGDNIGQGSLKCVEFKYWRRTTADKLDRYQLRAGDVVLAMDRPWIPAGLKWARIRAGNLPALLVQRVARLRANSSVLHQDFLNCIISSSRFTKHVLATQTGNTVPHISGASIAAFNFRLPPMQEQVRLATVLEKFDALTNDLSIGLSAELAARCKQYEYYRDKLLTFQELPA